MTMNDEHRTYIERDVRGYYFWCEAEDCYVPPGHRFHTEAEACALAGEHERNPG